MISLVKDTIDKQDIDNLILWLNENPRLTKGEKTIEFEKIWSEYTGVKYSVYVNSGSSANLAMAYALQVSGHLRNKVILAPAVSWVTTVSPFIQLGYNVKLFDCDKDTLGPGIINLEKLMKKHKPSVMIFVHVLGIPSKMKEIQELCNKYDVILLEDSCESIGSTYNNKKTGSFGLMSSFSFYYGHHLSTIEGGMICTDDFNMYNILKALRSHGWDRDLDEPFKLELKREYGVDEFKDLYTFYYPGFNLRSTDLQAYLGLLQMNKIDSVVSTRNENYKIYHENIKNVYWKIKPTENSFVSNFAYPIITPKIDELVNALKDNYIETRPLICGSISNQPFWIDRYPSHDYKMANDVDKLGLYLPNNFNITKEEILFICDIVNGVLNDV
jgi:CDP-6-deoxy-D-xylo-4-hexulose-3-dehydrase